MENDNTQHAPMSGDDELAKALGGGLQFEETPVVGLDNSTLPSPAGAPSAAADQTSGQPQSATAPTVSPIGEKTDTNSSKNDKSTNDQSEPPTVHHTHSKSSTKGGSSKDSLEKLKTTALDELRPLVGKLNLSPEEKFDTLLLIIRSTDDQSLLDEAHDAAKEISDEPKRAQALLDIIKEVDYFSSKRS